VNNQQRPRNLPKGALRILSPEQLIAVRQMKFQAMGDRSR